MSKNNENILVPMLRFPEFNNDGVWKDYTIDSIGEVVTGGTPSKEEKEYWGGDFVWVTAQDFKDKYIFDSVLKLTQEGKKKSRIIPKDSVLVTCIASIGLNAINKVECSTNQQINSIVCNPENHYEFVYYSITHNGNRLKNMAGQTAVPIINKSVFEKFVIHKPKSLNEQKKIAACLSSLDDVITAERQKLEALQDHKKGLLQNLLPQESETVPKFRFSQFEENGDWEETTLTQVADYENGKAHEQDIEDTGDFIVVNSKFISQDGEVKKFTNTAFLPAQKGDILMVLSDIPNGKAIAKCFLVEEDNRYTVNQRICRITPHKLNCKILYYLLNRNPYFLAFDDGVKQTNLRKEDVLNCPLLIPSDPKEQEKIAETLSTIDELIIAQSQKVNALMLHKKGLLQGLFPNLNEVNA